MKSKLVLAALLFALAFIPSHLFAATCHRDGAGNMHCDDGRFLHRDGAGNLHGSDGSFYHRDGGGNYHGSDGSYMHGGGGYSGGGRSRSAARAQARNQQCQRDCAIAYNECVQQSYCYDMCRSRCADERSYCINNCE